MTTSLTRRGTAAPFGSVRPIAAAIFLAAAVAAPTAAWAFGGGLGCTDLPDYARAQGALEGMTSACDMSVEQARAIVAAHDGVPAVAAATIRHRRNARRYRHRRHPDAADD